MSKNKRVLLFCLILIVILSWMNILDKQAYILNIESLKESSGAFVVIKGFAAMISFAENIPFVGKILTPYYEFIERMSFVMLLSLMSLGLQKVILVAMQSFLVNGVITLFSGIVIFNEYYKVLSIDWAKKILKLLLILIVIRFSIPFMTFTITSIQTSTYKIQAEISKERLEKLQTKIFNIREKLENEERIKLEKEAKIKLLEEKIETLDKEKEELETDIKNIKIAGKNFIERTTSLFRDYSPEVKKQVEVREKRIMEIEEEIKLSKDKINDSKDGFFTFEKTKEKLKIALSNLNAMMNEMFDIFVTWTILFFFRNIFFPIFFIWGLFKLVDIAFKTNYVRNIKV